MKFLLTFALALISISIESVVVKYLGLPLARIDVTVAIVAFLALRADLAEGAMSAYVVGYLLDLASGRPTGLYTFLAVLTFLLGRFADSMTEVRSPLGFAFFAMAADLGHGLFASVLSWLAKDGGGRSLSFSGLPLEVALTGGAALLLYPLLKRVSPGTERSEPGMLR